jgi:hypothetical protein
MLLVSVDVKKIWLVSVCPFQELHFSIYLDILFRKGSESLEPNFTGEKSILRFLVFAVTFLFLFSVLGWGETESKLYVGH